MEISFDVLLEENMEITLNERNVSNNVLAVDENMIFFLQEKMTIDAFSYFQNIENNELRIMTTWNLILDMVMALTTIHEIGYVHRDFKSDNIVYSDKDGHFKLIDFGWTIENPIQSEYFEQSDYGYTPFTEDTIFAYYASGFYDWHCLYITIFHLLHLCYFNGKSYIFYPELNNLSEKKVNLTGKDKDEKIDLKQLYQSFAKFVSKKYMNKNNENMIVYNLLKLFEVARFIQPIPNESKYTVIDLIDENGNTVYVSINTLVDYEDLIIDMLNTQKINKKFIIENKL